ncbi:MAG: insulinase family protein, partial [Motiliproteus sp.]|nr:insulinase family protein [Motiliproteus sp.]
MIVRGLLAFVSLSLLLLLPPLLRAEGIIKSPNDPRDYQAFQLENGLKVLLISDPKTDKAAVSLDVGVGSGDDPEQRQGLAHFLEHMLFLGTGKYPKAGEYQAYISAHGGSHNAFTAYDRTNYFFDIDSN